MSLSILIADWCSVHARAAHHWVTPRRPCLQAHQKQNWPPVRDLTAASQSTKDRAPKHSHIKVAVLLRHSALAVMRVFRMSLGAGRSDYAHLRQAIWTCMTGRDISLEGFQEDPNGPAPMDVENFGQGQRAQVQEKWRGSRNSKAKGRVPRARTKAKESKHHNLSNKNRTTSLKSRIFVAHVEHGGTQVQTATPATDAALQH